MLFESIYGIAVAAFIKNEYNINMGGDDLEKEEMIDYWISSSDSDYKTMNNLFESKDYHWSLFIGHLVIEKLLKAHLY